MISDAAIINAQDNALILSMLAILVVIVVFSAIFENIKPTKSQKARNLITDLYVIGTIRNFAKADNIDLNAEMKELRKLCKLERMSDKSLDRVIEDELKEKIQAQSEKNIDSMSVVSASEKKG